MLLDLASRFQQAADEGFDGCAVPFEGSDLWAAGRNRRHGEEQISGMLHYGTQNAFENEDEPMIRAVRSRMDSNDLFAHRPALLSIDEAAVRARRVLKRLIDAEAAAAPAAA